MNLKLSLPFIFLMLLNMSCITIPGNKLPDVPKESFTTVGPKTKVFYREKLMIPEGSDARRASVWKGLYSYDFKKILEETECCNIVESLNESDLELTITYHIDGPDFVSIFFATLTGASLFTIPSWSTESYKITVSATRQGKQSKYELEDQYTLVQWLPFLLAMPFNDPQPLKISETLSEKIIGNLLLKLKQDGFLVSNLST